jgi:hypothetical protein
MQEGKPPAAKDAQNGVAPLFSDSWSGNVTASHLLLGAALASLRPAVQQDPAVGQPGAGYDAARAAPLATAAKRMANGQ